MAGKTKLQKQIDRITNGGTGGANYNASRTSSAKMWDQNTGRVTTNTPGRNNQFVSHAKRAYDLRRALGVDQEYRAKRRAMGLSAG